MARCTDVELEEVKKMISKRIAESERKENPNAVNVERVSEVGDEDEESERERSASRGLNGSKWGSRRSNRNR